MGYKTVRSSLFWAKLLALYFIRIQNRPATLLSVSTANRKHDFAYFLFAGRTLGVLVILYNGNINEL